MWPQRRPHNLFIRGTRHPSMPQTQRLAPKAVRQLNPEIILCKTIINFMLNYMWVEGRGVQIYDLGQSQRTISGPFLYINQIDPELEARLDQDYVSQLFNNINWESRKKPTTRRNPDRLQLHKQFIIFILSPGFTVKK